MKKNYLLELERLNREDDLYVAEYYKMLENRRKRENLEVGLFFLIVLYNFYVVIKGSRFVTSRIL